MSETLVRLRYFVVVCLISSYYLVCYYHEISMALSLILRTNLNLLSDVLET